MESFASNKHEDLIRIIKTAYLRNKERTDGKRKISENNEHYFELAERYLYNEIGVVLNLSYNEIKKYVTDKVLSLDSSNK